MISLGINSRSVFNQSASLVLHRLTGARLSFPSPCAPPPALTGAAWPIGSHSWASSPNLMRYRSIRSPRPLALASPQGVRCIPAPVRGLAHLEHAAGRLDLGPDAPPGHK